MVGVAAGLIIPLWITVGANLYPGARVEDLPTSIDNCTDIGLANMTQPLANDEFVEYVWHIFLVHLACL